MHADYISAHDSKSADFRIYADATAALKGSAQPHCDADYEEWWQKLVSCPTFIDAGPVLKFARWLSIEQCWDYFRDQVWFVKAILEHAMNRVIDTAQEATTAMLDADHAESIAKASGTLIEKAPQHIDEQFIDNMDSFSRVR